jgi:hypothetical protein
MAMLRIVGMECWITLRSSNLPLILCGVGATHASPGYQGSEKQGGAQRRVIQI